MGKRPHIFIQKYCFWVFNLQIEVFIAKPLLHIIFYVGASIIQVAFTLVTLTSLHTNIHCFPETLQLTA